MVEVTNTVGNLLMHHNCVVIPNFGGFVATIKPSQINRSKGIIFPPVKSVSFNRNLQSNDGLLIAELAKNSKITYDTALQQIDASVNEIKAKLHKGERIDFQNVGSLYLNKEGSITFEQDRFSNLLLEAYGLESVNFIPQNEEVSVDVKNQENVSDEAPIISIEETKPTEKVRLPHEIKLNSQEKNRSIVKSVFKYAAVAALVPIAFYSFWIPMKTDVLQSKVLFKEDFNPFKESVEVAYTQKKLSETNSTITLIEEGNTLDDLIENLPENVDHFFFGIDEDHFIPVKLDRVPKTKNMVSGEMNETNGYHLIAGCFAQKDNALDLISQLNQKGCNAFILDINNGLHRVSVEQAPDRKSILSKRKTLKGQGVSTWVLKK